MLYLSTQEPGEWAETQGGGTQGCNGWVTGSLPPSSPLARLLPWHVPRDSSGAEAPRCALPPGEGTLDAYSSIPETRGPRESRFWCGSHLCVPRN